MVKSIAWQMLNGLAYLHENDVMHRDLKPQNILIMGDGVEHGVVKIADFGLARRCRSPPRPLIENGPVRRCGIALELLLGANIISWRWTSGPWARSWAELLTLSPLFRGVEEKSRDMYDRSQLEAVFAVLGPPTKRTGLICPRILSGPGRRRAEAASHPSHRSAREDRPAGGKRGVARSSAVSIRSEAAVRRRANRCGTVVPGTTPADAKFARSGGFREARVVSAATDQPTRREERRESRGMWRRGAPRARRWGDAWVSRLSGSRDPRPAMTKAEAAPRCRRREARPRSGDVRRGTSEEDRY